jgi:hypothetical protein
LRRQAWYNHHLLARSWEDETGAGRATDSATKEQVVNRIVRTLLATAALGAASAFALPAAAVSTLVAGPGSYGVGATTVAAEPDLAGMVVADRSQAFTINGSDGGVATGSIQETVVRSDATGFLDFYYQLILDSISGFEPGSYVEWLNLDPTATGDPLAVGRRTDGSGTATTTIYDLAGSGESRFDFNLIDLDDANAGFATQPHVVRTDATNYALTGQLRVSGFEFVDFDAEGIASAWLPTWAPAAIPEPEAWATTIVGFGLAGVLVRRRVRCATALA